MKKVLLFSILSLGLSPLFIATGQARRISPPSSTGKINQRTSEATPTPTPLAVTSAQLDDNSATADDGGVVKVETQLVTFPVRVMDRKNRFIGGLGKSDFKVYEDGVQQDLAYFTNEEQPFTVALVLDMSYSTKFKIAEIQAAAISFIDQLRDQDRVMVVSFDEDVHLLCEPTNDRQRIYRAIKSTRVTTGTSLYEAIDMVINDRLRWLKGRKAVILFTDGVDTTSTRSNDLKNLNDAMELDALIYPIRYDTFADVQAMKDKPVVSNPSSTIPLPTSNPSKLPFPFPMPSVGTPSGRGTSAEDYKRAEEYLDQLALRTGGRLFVANTIGNLNDSYAKIAADLREFYSLGYYPKDEGPAGKVRLIKVKVDQPGLVVKARDKYVVGKKSSKRNNS
jgi:Ca-activated chloride channel family protein